MSPTLSLTNSILFTTLDEILKKQNTEKSSQMKIAQYMH